MGRGTNSSPGRLSKAREKRGLGTRFGGLRDSFPHGQASYPRASKSLYHSVET